MSALARLVARAHLGLRAPGELVAWAVASLEGGSDSGGLRALAALDLDGPPREGEADALFERSLAELGLVAPAAPDAVRAYVRELAREIVDGRAEPRAQVARIHREVVSPLGHPGDLMAWCYADDGLRPQAWSLERDAMTTFESIPSDRLDETLRELARWYLAASSADPSLAPEQPAAGP